MKIIDLLQTSEKHPARIRPQHCLRSFVVFLLLSCFSFSLCSQSRETKGVPLIKNFLPEDYLHKGKVWDIASSPSGLVWMASDKGLLQFDGQNWQSFKGSKGATRSILILNDSVIYTGSDLDFGKWKVKLGRLVEYQSLYPFKEVAQGVNEEFWNVVNIGDDVFFISSQNIYVYRNEQLIKISAPSGFRSSFLFEGKLFLSDQTEGLFTVEDYSLSKFIPKPNGLTQDLINVFRDSKGLVFVSRTEGLLRLEGDYLIPIQGELSPMLRGSRVFSFERLGDNLIAFGTVLGGLCISDLEGRLLHQFNRYKGLQGNTILTIHGAGNGKVWISQDYGLSIFDLNNPITTVEDFGGQFGTGYAAIEKEGIFYLGTNQGLYTTTWGNLNNNRERFQLSLFPGTEGQVWALANINDQLFMGHDRGLFQVNKNRVQELYLADGVWTIAPFRNYLLTGNYNGVTIFRNNSGYSTFWKKMDLVLGSANQLISIDDQHLWVNIPNYGIVRVRLDEDMNVINREIFPDSLFASDEKIMSVHDKKIFVSTNQSIFVYNVSSGLFEQSESESLEVNPSGLIEITRRPSMVNADYEFVPHYNGFGLRDLQHTKIENGFTPALLIRRLVVFNNQTEQSISEKDEIPYQLNNIRLEYIVPNVSNVLYRFKINGLGEWSNWSTQTSLEYLKLSPGTTTVELEAHLPSREILSAKVDLFILSPWYQTGWAFLGYFMAFVGLVSILRQRHLKSLRRQKEALLARERKLLEKQEEKYRQELMLVEQQSLKNQIDLVQNQLKSKTVELAVKAKQIEEKAKLVITLREKLDKAQKSGAVSANKWEEMKRLLDTYLEEDDKTFEIQMDELHQEFFRKLKEQFPSLSGNDLRLCAYLKIGLNSKEIADLLHIQPSSSYISRSRLRKKLQLKADEDLYDFLNSL